MQGRPHSDLHGGQQGMSTLSSYVDPYSTWKCLTNKMLEDNGFANVGKLYFASLEWLAHGSALSSPEDVLRDQESEMSLGRWYCVNVLSAETYHHTTKSSIGLNHVGTSHCVNDFCRRGYNTVAKWGQRLWNLWQNRGGTGLVRITVISLEMMPWNPRNKHTLKVLWNGVCWWTLCHPLWQHRSWQLQLVNLEMCMLSSFWSLLSLWSNLLCKQSEPMSLWAKMSYCEVFNFLLHAALEDRHHDTGNADVTRSTKKNVKQTHLEFGMPTHLSHMMCMRVMCVKHSMIHMLQHPAMFNVCTFERIFCNSILITLVASSNHCPVWVCFVHLHNFQKILLVLLHIGEVLWLSLGLFMHRVVSSTSFLVSLYFIVNHYIR